MPDSIFLFLLYVHLTCLAMEKLADYLCQQFSIISMYFISRKMKIWKYEIWIISTSKTSAKTILNITGLITTNIRNKPDIRNLDKNLDSSISIRNHVTPCIWRKTSRCYRKMKKNVSNLGKSFGLSIEIVIRFWNKGLAGKIKKTK